jgi:hypothetical protein
VSALIAGLAATRRVLSLGTMSLALLAGLLAGLALLGLPEASLVAEIFPLLVQVLAALLLLPLAAALPSAERAGGFEQLVAVRPVSSIAWGLGRVAGGLLGAALLALLLGLTARAVGGRAQLPLESVGRLAGGTAAASIWRFEVPEGARGPFDLQISTVPLDPSGTALSASVRRGARGQELRAITVQRRSAVLAVPDLAPERGPLEVTLRCDAHVVQADPPPRLVLGHRPLGRGALPLPWEAAGPLLLGVLAALAAGSAFHFPTACLAGLLGVSVPMPGAIWTWALALAGLLTLAVLGTALQRRAAMP